MAGINSELHAALTGVISTIQSALNSSSGSDSNRARGAQIDTDRGRDRRAQDDPDDVDFVNPSRSNQTTSPAVLPRRSALLKVYITDNLIVHLLASIRHVEMIS